MSSKKKSKKNVKKTGKSNVVVPISKTNKSKVVAPIKMKKKSPLSKKPDNLSKKNSEDITKLSNLVKKVEKLVKKVENPIQQPLNNQQIYKNQVEQQMYKETENIDEKTTKPQIKNIDLLDKYGYDIYNDDEKRHESLGNLVIVYGISDLLKKLDSESMKTPNLSNKFNVDKKWIKDNFGK
jgi:hypothetical protein